MRAFSTTYLIEPVFSVILLSRTSLSHIKGSFSRSNYLTSRSSSSFKWVEIPIPYNSWSKDTFTRLIQEHFTINTTYTLLIKVVYGPLLETKMVSRQLGLSIQNTHNISYYESLFEDIEYHIETLLFNYGIETIPHKIVLMSRVNTVNSSHILENIKNVQISRGVISNKTKFHHSYNSNILPLSFDSSSWSLNWIHLLIGQIRSKYLDQLIETIQQNNKALSSELWNPESITNVFLVDKNQLKYLILECVQDDVNIRRLVYKLNSGELLLLPRMF